MLHAVVMAGGSGTRFWPKSRRNRPKQLLCLAGDSTMLQQTVERVADLVAPDQTWVITGADQAAAVRAQLPPSRRERRRRALPARHGGVRRPGGGDRRAARPRRDHAGHARRPRHQPGRAFQATVQAAVEVVEADPTAFVTFGIKPTRPETGYGYIERGEELGSPGGIKLHRVVQFREKPDRATAERFLAEGRFAWNAGIFVWRAQAILDALATHRPELAAAIDRVRPALGTPGEAEAIAREYPSMEKVPIDKAVMEKAANVRVLEVVYDWNDVGDWRALRELVASRRPPGTRCKGRPTWSTRGTASSSPTTAA